ncbi:MAG: cytochrome c biogenesis heme-transporting ATPase CcmA [Pseudomonadota bacterium]
MSELSHDQPLEQEFPLVQLNALECVRSDRVLFTDLSTNVLSGEIMQIEGPNGAGKTSLIRILCGFLTPAAGEVSFKGKSIHEDVIFYQSHLLYIGHSHGVKAELTVMENLTFYAGISSTKSDANLSEAIKGVGLYGYEDALCSDLSAGQRRRVALARLLITDASLWILDEPFVALDKKGVVWLESLLIAHAKQGGAVIFTSHQDFISHASIKRLNINEFACIPDF